MFTIDQINELRAELAGCVFTQQERSRVEAELAALIAERDAAELADLEAFAEGRPDHRFAR